MLMVYMHDCHARGLRPKTMKSYEQTLRLFGVWIADRHGIVQVEGIHAAHIRSYISDLQTRGKYTYCSRIESMPLNQPLNRRDYSKTIQYLYDYYDFGDYMDKAAEDLAAQGVV